MQLDTTIAQKIVKRAMQIIHYSVNVMNDDGVIIASGNPKRLSQRHTGAILVLRENRVVEVDQLLAQKWNFEAQPGINLPIHYLGKVIGVVGISGDPTQVKQYAELVKMTAELIVEQHALLEQERWRHRYKEEFILQLLHGNLNWQEIEQQAEFFSFDLTKSRVVILIKLLHPNSDSLQHLINYLEQPEFAQDVAILSLDQVVVLKTQTMPTVLSQQIKTLLPTDYTRQDYKMAVGASLNMPLSEQLPLSFQSAQSTLSYGMKHHPRKNIYRFEEYRLPVLLTGLSSSWQGQELLKPIVPLFAGENATLYKTLQQYFLANCDLHLTAEKLFIHPNTLRYRLAKIEQLTGLSFNKIDDMLSLYLSTILVINGNND
ncbi:sugar diacid recognition domain-containing protein [Rodentibacter pneumotropicus]|uniref:CdaR family transcriptional regulator n=1 Tax=Rodentibacter pneumotropicus TaxID=758 RepID=UPI00232EB8BA|nr:CdaR family transcriptional regulator [Rodentibacter pneumotropicus]MDC2826391.1 sugar diacid recognition domain-containing protein [Rodentibacter pneumotropicus]